MQALKAGTQLEMNVANAYRRMGAWKVEHDVDMAGNQIDVYAELEAPGHFLHRVAVEVKDWKSPVGIDIVNRFAHIVKHLRTEQLIDEGIIVSSRGFSRPARNAARTYGIRLLEMADLDVMVTQAETSGRTVINTVSPLAPPRPCFVHPYPLQENFTGRVRERQMLTDWFSDDSRPVLSLTAMGGMGKSALTWAWLLHDILGMPLSGLSGKATDNDKLCAVEEKSKPEGVFWWSFYDPEANFAAFVDRALIYASGGGLDPASVSSTHDKVRMLVDLFQQSRLLLVLDGFERELRAYASLSAVYRGDAVLDEAEENYRSCTDLHAANFLRWMASTAPKGKVLLTSRLLPGELDELAGCRREELAILDPDDAMSFFKAQGIKGSRVEVQAACELCGYHPLTLRLLAGVISRDPVNPGDVSTVANYDLMEDVVSQETHVLSLAFDALSRPLQELLSRLAAFRSPVGYEVAMLLTPFESKRQLGQAFSELAERGLIFFDHDWWRYGLHPIVRAYAYDHLANKVGVHNLLREYFVTALTLDTEQVEAPEELAPLIELYHHVVRAGRFDEAAEVFRDHLADPLYYRFGAYRTEIDLLRALFPDDIGMLWTQLGSDLAKVDESILPQLEDPSAQAWTLNALAGSYTCSGQASYAVPLLKMHNLLQEGLNDEASLAVGLQNLAGVQLELGKLQDAETNLRRSIQWGKDNEQRAIEASGRTDLGRLLAYQGAFEEASQELDTALAIQVKSDHVQSQVLSWLHRAQLALLHQSPQLVLDTAQSALRLAEESAASAQETQTARSMVTAHWLLGAAHYALGQAVEAETYLSKALIRCRQINLVELEPDILLSWARWEYSEGDQAQAREYADEALSIAGRSEYRLKEAEILAFLAQHTLDSGDLALARKQAEAAKARAWCDGPPHVYRAARQESLDLLAVISQREAGAGGRKGR